MEKKKEIINNLIKSYWMEIETVINYISNSINLDGVRAEEIKKYDINLTNKNHEPIKTN